MKSSFLLESFRGFWNNFEMKLLLLCLVAVVVRAAPAVSVEDSEGSEETFDVLEFCAGKTSREDRGVPIFQHETEKCDFYVMCAGNRRQGWVMPNPPLVYFNGRTFVLKSSDGVCPNIVPPRPIPARNPNCKLFDNLFETDSAKQITYFNNVGVTKVEEEGAMFNKQTYVSIPFYTGNGLGDNIKVSFRYKALEAITPTDENGEDVFVTLVHNDNLIIGVNSAKAHATIITDTQSCKIETMMPMSIQVFPFEWTIEMVYDGEHMQLKVNDELASVVCEGKVGASRGPMFVGGNYHGYLNDLEICKA